MLSDDLRIGLARARRRLAEESTASVPVSELAAACGLSTSHFIRRFKAVFGSTPHQFRIQSRLARVRWQLATQQRPITDICLATEAASLGSFTTQFTRRVGQAPSRYRHQMQSRHRTVEALSRTLQPGCMDLMARALAGTDDRDFREAAPDRASYTESDDRTKGPRSCVSS